MSILTYLHLRDSVMDTYLKVLDCQNEDITHNDSDKLTVHSHMEQELLQRIEALQKVITGLSGDRAAGGGSGADTADAAAESREEQQLEQRFNEKCELALQKNRENQDRLSAELGVLTRNLENVRRFRARTGRGCASPQSRYIDIET
ncbi:MAG: hypothetical protein ACOCZA_05215 [Spirochaetota bacterium]